MRNMSKLEQHMFKKQHLEQVQAGSGLYVFQNNTNGTLMLPRATRSGRKEVEAVDPKKPGSGQFQGDSYFLQLVRQNVLRLVKTIEAAIPQDTKPVGHDTPEYRSLEKNQVGKGLFLYENNTGGSLLLPKPTQSGVRAVTAVDPKVPGSGRFQGDDYYMQLVRNNMLRLIKVLRTPEQESVMAQNKLLLDQPDTITRDGKVEHVQDAPLDVVSENDIFIPGVEKKPEVLLTEDPLDGIQILAE